MKLLKITDTFYLDIDQVTSVQYVGEGGAYCRVTIGAAVITLGGYEIDPIDAYKIILQGLKDRSNRGNVDIEFFPG